MTSRAYTSRSGVRLVDTIAAPTRQGFLNEIYAAAFRSCSTQRRVITHERIMREGTVVELSNRSPDPFIMQSGDR